MNTFVLRGSGPVTNLLTEATRLRGLADDLEAIHRNMRAPRSALRDAPLLENWRMASRPSPCLSGTVTGHPDIGDGRPALTSDLWAVDPARGYARTLSRFYRLGRRGED